MRTSLLSLSVLLCVGACTTDPPVYIGTGTYTFISQEDDAPLEALADVDVMINVDRLTFAMGSPDMEFQTSLVELPEDEWMENCPTNFSAVQLQTMKLADPLQIEEDTLEEPLVFADGCVGDQGETATRIWLSSVAFQESSNSLGDGLYLLEMN